jgi:flagellar biogenesis protein FliO
MFSVFVPPMPESTPQDFRESFEMTWKVMIAFTVVIALGFAGLFAWIVKRLVSQDIKREFLAL